MEPMENEIKDLVADAMPVMSHRIKNILQGVNGGSHLIDMGITKQDLAITGQGWSIVKRNQNHLAQLLLNILVLSKPYEANRESSDILQVVHRAVQTLTSGFELSHVAVTVEVGESGGPQSIDTQAIQLLIENMLTVAMRRAAQFDAAYCKVSVRDDVSTPQLTFSFGGAAPRENHMEDEEISTASVDQAFERIEMEAANRIACGHDGEIKFDQTDPNNQIIRVLIPRS